MVDVYINYDCDVQCTNLFESICHSLSTHALPRDGKARLKQWTLGVKGGEGRGGVRVGVGVVQVCGVAGFEWQLVVVVTL